jgi:multidrug transporter EmrE-like cation transporter
MHHVYVIAAALAYTVGGYFMKEADGFARLGPALAVLGLFGLGATLQIFAMRGQEMTTTYLVVLGLEAVCAFAFGVLLLGEALTWQKVAGSVIVCAGVALLRGAI